MITYPIPRPYRERDDLMPDLGEKTPKKIKEEAIFRNLDSITKKYADSLSEKANAYADSIANGEFDSDDELLDKAKESLDELYNSKKEKIRNKTETSVDSLEEEIGDYQNDRARAQNKLTSRYEKAAEREKEDFAKKGISHSSIANLSAKALSSDYQRASKELDAGYDRKVQAIEAKINKLNAAYTDAMKNYEISYAIELEDKLDSLKKKRDQLVKTYEKEHQSDRKEAYDLYLAEEAKRNRDYEIANGDYLDEKKENYQERYDYLVGALAGEKASLVKQFVKDNEDKLKEYLGLYYDRFKEEVV